jgi:hypothetical protein
MSEREEIVIKSAKAPVTEPGNIEIKTEPTQQERAMERAKRKARIAQVLDRGNTHDRLHVELPPDIHGEWCRNDPLEIERLRTLGFDIDREYAPKRAINSDGPTDVAIVGDVIHMIAPREVKELIDEIRAEQLQVRHGKPGEGKAKEEKDFATLTEAGTGGDIPTFTESKTRQIHKADILAAVTAVDSQIQPVNK